MNPILLFVFAGQWRAQGRAYGQPHGERKVK